MVLKEPFETINLESNVPNVQYKGPPVLGASCHDDGGDLCSLGGDLHPKTSCI